MADDQQALLEPQAQRRKREYVHRRNSGAGSSLDIAFEKSFRTGRGNFAGRRSGADILLEQQCERALNGSARALMAVVKHHEENQKALEAWQSRFAVRQPHEPEPRKLIEAALLLDIFTLDVGVAERSWYLETGFAHWTEFKMLLSDWAEAAGVKRWEETLEEEWRCDPNGEWMTGRKWNHGSADHQERLEHIREFTADIYIKDPLEPEMRKRVLASLADDRCPEATRWRKGQSGNLWGGAYKQRKFQLPFGYLEELVVVEVGGRRRELTRFEALISQLQDKAIDAAADPASRQLAAILAKQQLARWAPQHPTFPEKPETTQERAARLAKTNPKTVYECMATLGMLSARAKKSYLLEPWIVELGLKRLKRRRLKRDQQNAIMRVTRRPHDYIWPKWWDDSLFGEGGRKPSTRPPARKRRVLDHTGYAEIVESRF